MKTVYNSGMVRGTSYEVVDDESFVEQFGNEEYIVNCNTLDRPSVVCRTLLISSWWLNGNRTFEDVVRFSIECNAYYECMVDDVIWIPHSWIEFIEEVMSELSGQDYDEFVTRK